MRGCKAHPWILFFTLAWVVPATAGEVSVAGKKGGSVRAERADGLPRTGFDKSTRAVAETHSHAVATSVTVLPAVSHRTTYEVDLEPVGFWNNHPHPRGPRTRPHRRGSRRWAHPESYMILKGGGLFVAEKDGLYLGVEVGGSVDDVVDVGVSLDYFHRSTSERVRLADTQFEDLPVEVVATLDQSSAHLVPLGLTLRVRLPFGGDTFAPFVSGTAAYETLFLNNVGDPNSEDPIQRLLDEDETFSGFGWQAAAGLDLRLSPTLGVYGEIGMHRSSPGTEIDYQGLPVDLKVDLDGAFLRGGLRLSL